MGAALDVDLGSGVPFELARRILGPTVPDDPPGELRMALQPLFHHPRAAGESVAPRIKGELRLPTARRASRNFAFAARHLLACGVDALDVSVRGRLTEADAAFLHVVAALVPTTMRLRPVVESASADDAETRRVIEARDTVITGAPGERQRSWCRALAHYLSSGDPWTACWVAEQVMHSGIPADPETAVLICAAYLYSDRAAGVHTARDFCRIALEGEPRIRALALYNLAIIELRYLPENMRENESVPTLLDEADGILASLPFDDVASEIVLTRNARALHLLSTGHGEAACAVLRDVDDALTTHGHAGTTAQAIVLNNYGRALARCYGTARRDQAWSALQTSARIDGDHPEGWLDLAQFLAEHERFADAVDAARAGLGVVDMVPELWDVLGFSLAALGEHAEAGRAYESGLRVGGEPTALGVAAARQYLRSGNVPGAAGVLARVPDGTGDHETQAEIALLRLEAESSPDPVYLQRRVAEIAARFPDSDLARENLAAAREWARS